MSTELPRQFYLVLALVALVSFVVGVIVSPDDYMINIVASVTGFCTVAAVVAPLLIQYERRREFPLWRLAASDVESATLDAFHEAFPSVHILGDRLLEPQRLQAQLADVVDRVGLLRSYRHGLKPTWRGELQPGSRPSGVSLGEFRRHAAILADDSVVLRLRSFELDGLKERIARLASETTPAMLAIDYDEQLAASVSELRAATSWLVDGWWWARGPRPTVNLRTLIEKFEESCDQLNSAGADPDSGRYTLDDLKGDDRDAFTGALMTFDELVVFLDKTAWVLAQMASVLNRLDELRTKRERLVTRWPWSRGIGQSLVGSTIDAPQSYRPRLLPRVEELASGDETERA